MAALLQQRCWHHGSREAIARCPECGRFFCRECITEHEERIVCASCLKQLTAQAQAPRRSFASLGRVLAAALGLLAAWLFFFLAGSLLVRTPSEFHEATLWKDKVEDELQKEDPR